MPQTLGIEDMLATKFQPLTKRQYIFAIEGIDAFLMKSAARPQITTEEVAIPWINTTRYIGGKTTFGTLAVVLYDAVAPSGAQQVMNWIRLTYESVSGRAGYADFYKRDIQIKMLDPVGTVVQLWDIKGAWIQEANFGELQAEGSDLAEISLTLRFDNACLQF